MTTVTVQFEVDDGKLEALVRLLGAAPTDGRGAGRGRRRRGASSGRLAEMRRDEARHQGLSFEEGSPESQGNYARLWKHNLRPQLWEMIYRAAAAFGSEPFTLEQLADELAVEPEEIRKRMRALGRSRVISDIVAAIGGARWETTREDAMPWLRERQPDGRWVYRFGRHYQQPEDIISRWVLAEGLD
jgi:hypothetical protein